MFFAQRIHGLFRKIETAFKRDDVNRNFDTSANYAIDERDAADYFITHIFFRYHDQTHFPNLNNSYGSLFPDTDRRVALKPF